MCFGRSDKGEQGCRDSYRNKYFMHDDSPMLRLPRR
jgi:hypothetical protein